MKSRFLSLAALLLLLFGILTAEFFRLGVIEHDKWAKLADRQHYFVLKEPFHRGSFYSNTSLRKGHPEKEQKLVLEVEKYHLYADPLSIPELNKDEIRNKLADILRPGDQGYKKLTQDFNRKTHSRRLKMWLDKTEKKKILNWWNPYAKLNKIPLNALFFVSEYQRSYPFGKLLGQLLHTTQGLKDEKTNQAIPTGGLELYFDKLLQGKVGKKRLARSPRNQLELGDVIETPENGADIYLTINHVIQAIAEEELMKGVKKCKAKSGWAAMMNPKTGEILALAQYPFFDPGHYQDYYKDPILSEATKLKAVSDANEPGSVMKPLNIAIALKAGVFKPEEKIFTGKGIFKGRSKPLLDTRQHNYLNLDMAIQKSSNVYMAEIVDRLIAKKGANWYRDELVKTFGIGEKTGVEVPGETKGVLPRLGKKHPNGTLEWSLATPYSLAIGYNLQMNTLQILRAHAVFANGGILVEPTLVRKIVKQGQTLLDNTLPDRIQKFPRVLPGEITKRVVEAMQFTTKPGGTARKADVWGYTEAGKTSTSHKLVNGVYSKQANIANFVGFTPVKDPEFILIVTMDEPECRFIPGVGKNHHGGVASAPVFREIARRTLEYLGSEPDDPFGFPMQDPRFNKEKAHWMPETSRLHEMYEKWNISN